MFDETNVVLHEQSQAEQSQAAQLMETRDTSRDYDVSAVASRAFSDERVMRWEAFGLSRALVSSPSQAQWPCDCSRTATRIRAASCIRRMIDCQ